MLVAALITGFDNTVQDMVKQFGADTAFVSKWSQGMHGGDPPVEEQQRKPLTMADANALRELCPAIKNVTAFLQTNWQVQHAVRTKAGEVTGIDFRGVQPNSARFTPNAATIEGRFLADGDEPAQGKSSSCSARTLRRFFSRRPSHRERRFH